MQLPIDPLTISRLIAAGRIAIGVTAFARPTVGGAAFRSGQLPPEGVDGWRLAGARDIALGVGVFMAGRRAPGRMRGWVEAGTLADAMDVVAFASSPGLRTAARVGGAAVAAGAAAVGILAAREITRD